MVRVSLDPNSSYSVIYSFWVATVNQTFTSSTELTLAGTGIVGVEDGDGNVTDSSAASWQLDFLTGDLAADHGTYNAIISTSDVPDGGGTGMLLGIALSGLGLLKKKITA